MPSFFNQGRTVTVIILGVFWGLAIPGLVKLYNWLDEGAS